MKQMIFLALVIAPSMLLSSYEPPSLHVLIACDTLSPMIKTASLRDAQRVQRVFRHIASQSGLHFRPTVLKGTSFTHKRFTKWLKTIKKSSKDVVLFYYSGRGKRGTIDRWPMVKIFDHKKRRALYISEKKINKCIRSQKPRFSLVVFDCYKMFITYRNNHNLERFQEIERPTNLDYPGLRRLFRKNSGMFMACSGKDVDSCFCSVQGPPIGGLFTSAFLRGIYSLCWTPKTHWGRVFQTINHIYRDSTIKRKPILQDKMSDHYRGLSVKGG
jgi:hypothetical protein